MTTPNWRNLLILHSFPSLDYLLDDWGQYKKKPKGMRKGWQKLLESQINKDHKGLACLTGEVSGIIVLDFDDIAVWSDLKDKYPILDEVPRVATRKGFHLYFKYSVACNTLPSIIKNPNGTGNIDIQGNGKQVFFPGCYYILEDKKTVFTYEWDKGEDNELCEIPDDLMKYLGGYKIIKPTIEEIDAELPLITDNERKYNKIELQAIVDGVAREYYECGNGTNCFKILCAMKKSGITKSMAKAFCEKAGADYNDEWFKDIWKQNTSSYAYNIEYIRSKSSWTEIPKGECLIDTADLEAEEEKKKKDDDDVISANKLLDFLKNEGFKFINCEDSFYTYIPDRGIWKKTIEVRKYINSCDALNNKYRGKTKNQNDMLVQFKALVDIDEEFIKNAHKTTYQKLAFTNGIYYFTTAQLMPFSSDYVFFGNTGLEYSAKRNLALQREITEKLLTGIFGDNDIGAYYLQIVARALAGEIDDKSFNIITGEGNSGKGVHSNLLSKAFGYFIGIISAGVFNKKRGDGDDAKAQSWKVGVRSCRIVISNETTLGQKLDGNELKRCSGGDPCVARKNFTDEQEFTCEFTVFKFENDTPEIEPYDTMVHNRIVRVPTAFTYLDKDKMVDEKYIKKYGNKMKPVDPDIKSVFSIRQDVIKEFGYMCLDAYGAKKPEKPQLIKDECEEWAAEENDDDKVLSLFTKTGNKDDYETCKAFAIAVTKADIKMSPTKIGRLMTVYGCKSKQRKLFGKCVNVYEGIKLGSVEDNKKEAEKVEKEEIKNNIKFDKNMKIDGYKMGNSKTEDDVMCREPPYDSDSDSD